MEFNNASTFVEDRRLACKIAFGSGEEGIEIARILQKRVKDD